MNALIERSEFDHLRAGRRDKTAVRRAAARVVKRFKTGNGFDGGMISRLLSASFSALPSSIA